MWAWPGCIYSPILLPIQQVWWKRNASPCLLYWLLRIKRLLYEKPAYLPSCRNSWGHYLELPACGLPPLPVEPLFSPSPSPPAIHLLACSPLTWENQIMHLSLPLKNGLWSSGLFPASPMFRSWLCAWHEWPLKRGCAHAFLCSWQHSVRLALTFGKGPTSLFSNWILRKGKN